MKARRDQSCCRAITGPWSIAIWRLRGLASVPRRAVLSYVMVLVAACGKGKDADFAAMQERGQMVMGVDQYTSAHVFEDLPDGGRIILDRDSTADTSGVATAFRAGDFTKPFQVHAQVVPGTDVMRARRAAIDYQVIDRPRGGEV